MSLIDFEVDCLQLQVEASPQNVDLSVDHDEAFDMKALAERARADAAVLQENWDQCIAKMASDGLQIRELYDCNPHKHRQVVTPDWARHW